MGLFGIVPLDAVDVVGKLIRPGDRVVYRARRGFRTGTVCVIRLSHNFRNQQYVAVQVKPDTKLHALDKQIARTLRASNVVVVAPQSKEE